ncbi:MAG: calcium-binding protein [Planctomycetaceae bacterium]
MNIFLENLQDGILHVSTQMSPAGIGADIIYGGIGNEIIIGGAGDDTVTGGNAGVDIIFGNNGEDDIVGRDGFNVIVGGEHDDTLTGGNDGNLILGDTFDFSIAGVVDIEAIKAGRLVSGVGIAAAGSGEDVIIGGDSFDLLIGGDGSDQIVGGDGLNLVMGDSFNFEASNFDISGTFTAVAKAIFYGDPNNLLNELATPFELVGSGDDHYVGGSFIDIVLGGEGNDTIYGGPGDDDIVFGGLGDDTLIGGLGNDHLESEEGADRFYGNAGNDRIFGGVDDDQLYGGSGDDELFGEGGNDFLSGQLGDDQIFGGPDDDVIYGGPGADNIDGGAGANKLFPDRLASDSDDDADVDGFDFLNWQKNFGTTTGASVDNGDADANGAVDGDDLAIWESMFRSGPAPPVAAATMSSEQVIANSIQDTQTAALTAEPLSAEMVDAAIAMDQALRSESGARLGSYATLQDEHFDWVSHRARWGQPPVWRRTGEIADHSFRGQSSKGNEGRFHRNADDRAVDEELLDELFAEGGLGKLL